VGHHSEAFIGIDTSKSRNAVAIADGGRGGEVRFLGEFPATEAAIRKLVSKLAAKYAKLTFCYEAGPTGYGLYRLIKSLGHECIVVAPSLIPKKPGERVKTNRRDVLSDTSPVSGYRETYCPPVPARQDAELETRAGVSRASVVNARTKMGRSSAESEDSRLFSVARTAGIPSARTRCPSFVRLTAYARASPFVRRRRSHPYETSRFANSAMLERSMPVAAPSSVWFGASASATACNTINCRSVSCDAGMTCEQAIGLLPGTK
jgi:hypothetical protein